MQLRLAQSRANKWNDDYTDYTDCTDDGLVIEMHSAQSGSNKVLQLVNDDSDRAL